MISACDGYDSVTYDNDVSAIASAPFAFGIAQKVKCANVVLRLQLNLQSSFVHGTGG